MSRNREPAPEDFAIARRYLAGGVTLKQVGTEFGLAGHQVWWRVFKVERFQYEAAQAVAKAPRRVVGNVVYL